MQSVKSYLTDAFYEFDTRSVCEHISFITHTHTHRSIWKYFPLFFYVLVCVVFWFGYMRLDVMLAVFSTVKGSLSARAKER